MTTIEIIKNHLRWFIRRNFDEKNRKRMKKDRVSIISSNCTGGVIYHALGLKFDSPTINMYFSANDFIRFLKNPTHYFECDLVALTNVDASYPVVRCDDIILYCVHYKTLEEVKRKWKQRSKRIDWDNCYVIFSERDGCTEEDLREFEKLPYKNKVVFVHKPMPELKSSFYIPGTELNNVERQSIQPLTSYQSRFSAMRFIDRFDYVEFFNSGNKKLM